MNTSEYILRRRTYQRSFPELKPLMMLLSRYVPNRSCVDWRNGAGKSTLMKCLLESISKIQVIYF